MADVASSLRERGQLILVGGLSLAVVFVVLALILNSAIYTENLATRTSDNPADTPIQFRQDAVAGVGSAMDHVNRNGGDREYSDRYDEYQSAVTEWQRMHANYSAMNGLYTEVRTLDEEEGTEGTLIADDERDGNYTSRDNQTDWLVASNVQVRQFRLNVDQDSLRSQGDSEFSVEIDGGESSRTVSVYEESGAITVESGPDATSTCTAEGPSARIDITGGTLNGTHCEALSFVEDLSGTYDVRYVNANAVTGTYQLTVDQEESAFLDARYSDGPDGPDDGTPYTTPAIYSVTVELVYDGPSVTYETTVRVAPGEPDESAVTPPAARLDGFDGGWDGGQPSVSGPTSGEIAEDDSEPLSRECDGGVGRCSP